MTSIKEKKNKKLDSNKIKAMTVRHFERRDGQGIDTVQTGTCSTIFEERQGLCSSSPNLYW